ncbi:MAG TPA: class I SAM-dependent methyltransferase [Bacteroidales bacterium]|nr:class I SAM-dependent methyltransferase [Bacteroidales bacterium]
MGKFKKLIKAAGLLLKKPYLLNKVIDDDANWMQTVSREYGIERLPEVAFREMLGGKQISVSPFSFLEGGSLPTDLALLRLLASRFQACEYFEIGTWRGESVANVAEVASSCTTMNLSVQQMKDQGMPDEYIMQYAMYSRDVANVLHLEGNSLEFDFSSLDRKFDLVFIDGDHHFESILSDTKNVFEHLLHNESIVVWHDHAWQPGHVRYETLAAILSGVPRQLHKNLYEVRNTLCAIYFPGEIASGPAAVVASKDETFTVIIE